MQNSIWKFFQPTFKARKSKKSIKILAISCLNLLYKPISRDRYLWFSLIMLVAQRVKNLPVMPETWGLNPGLGRSPGEGNGNPLQCFCLENSVDRGIWWATIHGVQQESDTTERPIHTHISKNALAFVAVLWLRVFVNTDIDRYTDINTYINFYRIHRYRYLSI